MNVEFGYMERWGQWSKICPVYSDGELIGQLIWDGNGDIYFEAYVNSAHAGVLRGLLKDNYLGTRTDDMRSAKRVLRHYLKHGEYPEQTIKKKPSFHNEALSKATSLADNLFEEPVIESNITSGMVLGWCTEYARDRGWEVQYRKLNASLARFKIWWHGTAEGGGVRRIVVTIDPHNTGIVQAISFVHEIAHIELHTKSRSHYKSIPTRCKEVECHMTEFRFASAIFGEGFRDEFIRRVQYQWPRVKRHLPRIELATKLGDDLVLQFLESLEAEVS